jgi:predicted nucleic acid-binding protein
LRRVYGEIQVRPEGARQPPAYADLQIAATALLHDPE